MNQRLENNDNIENLTNTFNQYFIDITKLKQL